MWNLARTLSVALFAALAGTAIAALVAPGGNAIAQEHRHHPPQDMPLHEPF